MAIRERKRNLERGRERREKGDSERELRRRQLDAIRKELGTLATAREAPEAARQTKSKTLENALGE